MTKIAAGKSSATFLRAALVASAMLLPSLSLLPLGGLYLWEKGWLLWWALGALLAVGIVALLQRRVLGAVDETPAVEAPGDPTWSRGEEQAWSEVRAIARGVDIDAVADSDALLELGLRTVTAVANRLHPGTSDAVWRFTLPEAFAIAERVSRRLAQVVESNIPFGDRMTVAQVLAVYRWRRVVDAAERAYDVWRLLRLANPATALTHEARERLSKALYYWGREHVTRRLIEAYVEEVGRAAIDLYGGRLRISGDLGLSNINESGRMDAGAAVLAASGQPLATLVAGATTALRKAIMELIEAAEQEQADAFVARHRTGRGASAKDGLATDELIAIEATCSQASDMSDRALSLVAAEVSDADIVVFLLTENGGLSLHERRTLEALNARLSAQPRRLHPALLPVLVAEGRSAVERTPALREAVQMAYGGTTGEVVVLDPEATTHRRHGAELWRGLAALAPEARRVALVRRIGVLQERRRWRAAGGQAASAVGSLAKALVSWRRGKDAPGGNAGR